MACDECDQCAAFVVNKHFDPPFCVMKATDNTYAKEVGTRT